MTRIAAGVGAAKQASTESVLEPMSRHAPEAGRTDGATGARPRGGICELGPDRPAPPAATRTRQAAADASLFLKELTRWEGEHRCMYVDTRGHVTTGIGHLLKNAEQALKLPWVHAGTGRPATQAEVKAAFQRLCQAWSDEKQANPAGKGPSLRRCRELSDLVLPEGLPRKLATERLNTEFLTHLRRVFPGFDGYPMPAQHALVDMAYNLGVGKLRDKFPTLLKACRDGDFEKAADECERSSSRKERNEATQTLFLQAAQLEASMRTLAKGIRL